MRFSVLGSGSKGNALYIESGQTSVLIDIGFSGIEIEKRLAVHGKDLAQLDAVFLTHEHADHIRGAGVLSRRFSLPVYANEGTFIGSDKTVKKLHRRVEFETGATCEVKDLEVRSFSISHDTRDPVGYLISDGRHSIACCTDTGHISKLVAARLKSCDGLILEFNHDPDMLMNGPYPFPLKQRVRSNHGHLANEDAAVFLQSLVHDKLQCAVLAHLSETNNKPELAFESAAAALTQEYQSILHVAPQHCSTEMFELD